MEAELQLTVRVRVISSLDSGGLIKARRTAVGGSVSDNTYLVYSSGMASQASLKMLLAHCRVGIIE